MKFNRRLAVVGPVAAGLAAALVAGPLASPASAAANSDLAAWASGAQEVPANSGDPDGSAIVLLDITPSQGKVCHVMFTRNIATPTAVHVHAGRAGEEGDAILNLRPSWVGCTYTTRAIARAIANRPRQHYVNIHNTPFPDGAVRGQLRDAG